MTTTTHPQRVLLVHRYFHPDVTTYAQMLEIYAQHLAGLGHQVTVLCGPPNYNAVYAGPAMSRREVRDGFTTIRCRLPSGTGRVAKLVGAITFPCIVAAHAVTRRRAYDVVSVTTMPPVLMGLAGWVASLRSRRTRYVYHCMDLYPEAALAQGMLDDGLLSRLAGAVDSFCAVRARPAIVLSGDMADTLRSRSPNATIVIANNFILANNDHAVEHEQTRSKKQFLFAGNLGRFQGIESLIRAAEIADSSRGIVEMVFMGAGASAGLIEERRDAGSPVRLMPFAPLRAAMDLIGQADYAVVSLAPGVVRAAYPSKLMTSLEMGRPILAVVEPDSELGHFVEKNELGVACVPGDPVNIAAGIIRLSERTWDHDHIQAVGRSMFDKELVIQQWSKLYGLV